MPFTMNLWRIQGDHLVEIDESDLDTEERLENWIERDPIILGIDILLVGRQVKTESGGVIDLLGINHSARYRIRHGEFQQQTQKMSWIQITKSSILQSFTHCCTS